MGILVPLPPCMKKREPEFIQVLMHYTVIHEICRLSGHKHTFSDTEIALKSNVNRKFNMKSLILVQFKYIHTLDGMHFGLKETARERKKPTF